jgi:hypothetical protein
MVVLKFGDGFGREVVPEKGEGRRIRDDFVGGSSVGPIPEVCGAVVVSGDVCLSPGSHDGSNCRMKRLVGQRFEEKKTSSFITEPRELLVKPGDHAPTSEVASNHAR